MGMANTDDEAQIFEDRALLEWAKEAPEHPGSYDYPASEEKTAVYHEAVLKHAAKKPRRRNRHGDR